MLKLNQEDVARHRVLYQNMILEKLYDFELNTIKCNKVHNLFQFNIASPICRRLGNRGHTQHDIICVVHEVEFFFNP